MMHAWGNPFGIGGGFMILSMILFWGLIIAGIALIVRAFGGGIAKPVPPVQRQESAALEILKERYARGEIEKDEYEERKRTLET